MTNYKKIIKVNNYHFNIDNILFYTYIFRYTDEYDFPYVRYARKGDLMKRHFFK